MQLQKHSSCRLRPRRWYVAISGLVALLALACVETPNGITSPDALIVTSSAGASIAVGERVQLAATARVGTPATLEWESSNPSVASVTESGLVTGVAVGIATITVSAGENTGSSTLIVMHPVPPGSAVLLAAGDISKCTNDFDEATAKILDANLTGTVAALGDNAYSDGSTTDFANCYNPTWGRHIARTRPAVGNHEYQTPDATGYYAYFGSKAGDPAKGYYSYNLGEWHIIVLNSNIARDASSAQLQWLRADLQANAGKACTLAYWHHPRFSSGTHGNDASQAPFWDALYAANADVILTGHDHNYERFAPQTPSGSADNGRGIRAFVVGTGGAETRTAGATKANSDVFSSASHGVLRLTLSPNGYAWQFLPVAGQTFTDSGTGSCH
jgi:hypothetical protein